MLGLTLIRASKRGHRWWSHSSRPQCRDICLKCQTNVISYRFGFHERHWVCADIVLAMIGCFHDHGYVTESALTQVVKGELFDANGDGGGKWRPFRFRPPSWMTSFPVSGSGNEVIQDGGRKRKGRHFPPPPQWGSKSSPQVLVDVISGAAILESRWRRHK